jgi:two-component system chemotaxis response regulator CheB
MNEEQRRDIIVIGASAGGVSALCRLAADLPPKFPAALLVVLHVGPNTSLLPELLAAAGPNTAAHARDGEVLRQGHFTVAPPDHHLLVADGTARLTRGPKEHYTRPAIDSLFRSAALEHGPRVIGVVLTGGMDDGTAGLQAIKRCGGLAVVQDPLTAEVPSMPASALEYVAVDYCLPLERMASTLAELVRRRVRPRIGPTPSNLQYEHAPFTGTVNAMNDLKEIAQPSALVCPECGGGLWEVTDAVPVRYRCHTGHGYSMRTLAHAMHEKTEDSIWAAVRALQERAAVTRRIAAEKRHRGESEKAAATDHQADCDEAHAADLRGLIDRM